MGGDIRSCRSGGGGGGGSSTCVVGMLLAILITVSVFEPVSSSARQQFFAAPGSYTYQRLDIHVTEKTTSRREDNRRSFIPASRGMSEFLPRASTSAVHDQLQTHTTGHGDGVQANLMHRYAPSSPFRPVNATRSQLMKESLSRDHIRVLGIHAHIQRMVNGMLPEAKFQTIFQQQHEEAGAGNSDFQAPVVSGLTMGSGEYFVQLSIGTPAKSTYLVVDTGSDILWLQCSPCANCYQQAGPVFNPLASSTYATVRCGSKLCLDLDISGCQQSDCLYQVDYGDGSFTLGDFSTDTVTLDSATTAGGQVVLNSIPMGCGHDNEGYFVGAAGLLGLGKGPLSFPSQVGAAIGDKFSYCLTDRETDTTDRSLLIFGDAAVPAGVTFTPQVKNAKISTFYYLQMTGISVGGDLLSIPAHVFQLDASGDGGVIIDSGTSVTRLANAAYIAMRDAFRAATRKLTSTTGFSLFDTCYDLVGMTTVNVPTVTLHFQNGADMDLPASNYLIPVDNSNTYCFAFAGTTGPSIIGNIQQQGFRVVYDNVNYQVGFVPGQCT